MIDLSEIVLLRSEVLDHDSEHMLIVGHRLPPVDVAVLPLLQRQQLVQPVVKLIFSLKHDRDAVVQRVESDHKFIARVSRVQLTVNIETFLQNYGAFWSCFGFPFPLVIVVLQPCGTRGCGVSKHEELLLVPLELPQRGCPYDRSILHQYA